MKSWCYMAQMSVNEQKIWLNQCVKNVIWVDKIWEIGCQGLGKNMGLKTLDTSAIKESK